MELLRGNLVAEKLDALTKARMEEKGIVPGLAVILVGEDKPSHIYVALKEASANRLGIRFEKHPFFREAREEDIQARIAELNGRADIHGIIVQLPLPAPLDADRIIAAIDPQKDTDGFHPITLERFLAGEQAACPVFPRAIIELVRSSGEALPGKKAAVFANSDLLGKIMVRALENEGIKGSYLLGSASGTEIRESLLSADVVVSACGKGHFISAEMIRDGAVVIDGGISYEGPKILGDIDHKSLQGKTGFVTPVPGGVGPVTVATLLARVTEAASE